MKILVNVTNLGYGGAYQVADSFCRMLDRYPYIRFVVAYNEYLRPTAESIRGYGNVKLIAYSFHNTWKSILLARDNFLDDLVNKENIDAVFSVFAPTWWTPKKPHLCGFALAHLVMPESPYFKRMSLFQLLRNKLSNALMTFFFWRCSKNYYTENPNISIRLRNLLHLDNVYTITNYYNQVFDIPSQQVYKSLPSYEGYTILTITNVYPHKNLAIAIDVSKILRTKYPQLSFRFVFTITKEQFPEIPVDITNNFFLCGPVTINECPSLYEQCDLVFQPTLLECFTAAYPEAMRMRKPIVTTDLEFARGLCGDSAIYYSALDAESAASAIYDVLTNIPLRNKLIDCGSRQLSQYDTYLKRADKIISICNSLTK